MNVRLRQRGLNCLLALMGAFVALACMGTSAAFADDGAPDSGDGEADLFAVSPLSTQADDNILAATQIPLNVGYTDSLTTTIGEHWYRITLDQPGRLELAFSGAYNSDGAWGVSLRDGDNDEISYSSHWADDFLAGNPVTSVLTGLPAGTFYIRVNAHWNGGSLVNLAYTITPKFTPSASWETELNDSVTDVDVLPLGTAVSGTMRNGGDQDWYRIDLPNAGMFQLSLKGDYASDGVWGVSLRDGDNRELSYSSHAASSFNAGNPATCVSTTLAAGTYYVRVDVNWNGGSLVNLPYELLATCPETLAAAEIEPIEDATYSGLPIMPVPVVTLNQTILERGTDYTLSYENNVDAGEATVIVNGAGRYTGSIAETFTIAKASNPAKVKAKKATVKYSKLKKKAVTLSASKLVSVSNAVGKVTYKKLSGSAKLKVASNGKVTVKKKTKKGTCKAKVRVTVRGNQNYKKTTKDLTLTVKVK